jgi:tRNA(fMet)-specific endonuclease VapC
MVLIDASILIEQERGRLDIAAHVQPRPDEQFFLSVVTVSELLHGVHRAADPGTRARRSAFVESVLDDFPIVGIDLLTARTHAELWAELARRAEMVGSHDLWLAATCVGRGMTLVTGNARAFRRVPGLDIEVWSS